MSRRVSDYEYELPPERIARYPADRRDESRLLVLPRGGGPLRHLRFREVVDLFRPGDLLVVNETRVRPARLLGHKPTGAPAEVLLLRAWSGDPPARGGLAPPPPGSRDAGRTWEALVRPGGKLKPGRRVVVAPGELEVEILDSTESGGRIVRLDTELEVDDALRRHGHVPLPPYLEREDEPVDRVRYQTVYARVPGSVAAPTAGLHFTPGLLSRLEEMGVRRAALSLDVGVGTFRPVDVDDPADHEMHAERFRIPEEVADGVVEARERGGRVWAVGTTVVRALESRAAGSRTGGSGAGGSPTTGSRAGVDRAAEGGRARPVEPGPGSTDLFIRPPYDFRVVDCLITNFHLPRSTLLMLVAAFGGYRPVMDAYREAVREGYRFYSYGDAMAVV